MTSEPQTVYHTSKIRGQTRGPIASITWRNDRGQLHRDLGPALSVFYENGRLKREEYWVHGKLHREDGPASTSWNPNGSLSLVAYLVKDKHHRLDGPALTWYSESGVKEFERFCRNGFRYFDLKTNTPSEVRYYSSGKVKEQFWYNRWGLHRKREPAYILYDIHGNVIERQWMKNCRLHRVGGPARIQDTHDLYQEDWMLDGQHHRLDGPAVVTIKREKTGEFRETLQYMQHNRLHRLDGPAYLEQDLMTKKVFVEEWYKRGKRIVST